MNKTTVIGAVIMAYFFAVPAKGAENLQPAVVVTASRIEEQRRAVTQQITVIGQEIIQKGQYQDIASLLQNFGFDIASYGPNQSSPQISMRGMSSSYSNPLDSNVLVLLDGTPFASTNLAMIPIDGIERIEILRGPGAVQYGSSAVGGVINVIPRKGGEKLRLSAEAGGGTWQAYRAMGLLSGEIRRMDFAASVGWSTQKKNYTTGSGRLYPNTGVDGRLGYLLNFGFNLNPENRLGLLVSGINDWGLGLSQNLEVQERYSNLDSKLRHINSFASASYTGSYKDLGLAWKVRYFNAYDQANYTYPDNNPLYSEDYTINVNQRGGEGQVSWNWKFLTLVGGMDYTDSDYSSGFNPRYSQKDTAGFLMAKLAFWDEFIIFSGGLRHDLYVFKANSRERSLGNTSLSAGVALNPFDWLTIRSNLAESFKVPSGLYVVGYESPTGNVAGNPDLDPEKGLGFDVGMEARYRGLRGTLTWFATDYRDKISSRQISAQEFLYYNSSGVSHYKGLEGQLSFDLGEFFEWDFTLRPYLNFTKLFEYSDSAGQRLFHVRDFVASYGVSCECPDWGLDLDLRLNYLGYQKEYVFDSNYNRSEKRTGNITVADFFISKTIHDFGDGGKLSVRGEVRNLTNENYATYYDYPQPGRSFYLGVRYEF